MPNDGSFYLNVFHYIAHSAATSAFLYIHTQAIAQEKITAVCNALIVLL